MSTDEHDKSTPTIRNLVTTLIYTTEAIINILERKDILTRVEIIEEIRGMKNTAESQEGSEKK